MLYIVQNCWFCNSNSNVWIARKNSWTCQHCKQYNGFTEEGDYNKEIKSMHQIKESKKKKNGSFQMSSNCLCDHCNYYQQLKIDKLAEFRPKNEENYDSEIKSYKEYLEKIYEICEQCKSKVKFEITKQNGVLKQYFLNLGNYSYFCENKYNNNEIPASLTSENEPQKIIIKKKDASNSNLSNTLKALCFLFIFIFATLILAFNDNKLKELSPNSTLITFLLNLERVSNETRDYVFDFIKIDSKEEVFNYFNKRLLVFLFALYPFGCFLVATSKKQNSLDFIGIFLIWLIDLGLIISNFKQYLIIFESNEISDKNSIDLGYSVLILMPIIQVIIISKLIKSSIQLFKSNKHIPKHKLLNEIKFPISTNVSPLFKSNQSIPAPSNDNVNFNFSSITPKTYTLMKYLESDSPKPLFHTNKKVFSSSNTLISNQFPNNIDKSFCYAYSASDLLKPARFLPSESSFFKAKTQPNRKNSMDDSIDKLSNNSELDDSDESSIISGITNLYLNKTKASIQLFGSEPNLLNRSKMSNESCYHSFYQETPNRSFISKAENRNIRSQQGLHLL